MLSVNSRLQQGQIVQRTLIETRPYRPPASTAGSSRRSASRRPADPRPCPPSKPPPALVSATLVKMVFWWMVAMAFGLVLTEVPGATTEEAVLWVDGSEIAFEHISE